MKEYRGSPPASLVYIVIRLHNTYKEIIFNIIDLINIILYYL